MSVIRCVTLFHNRIVTIESWYGCSLLSWLFGFVFWRLHRLHSLWVSRQVTHNSIWPIIFRYNCSEPAGVFILGRKQIVGIRL